MVVIAVDIPREPGMTHDDLFNINASIVRIIFDVVDNWPNVFIYIISN